MKAQKAYGENCKPDETEEELKALSEQFPKTINVTCIEVKNKYRGVWGGSRSFGVNSF